MVETEDVTPATDELDQSGTSDVWRWIIGLMAVAFLVGAVGYLVGVRNSEDNAALSPVDQGFLIDMTAHHDQAIEMALLELNNGSDPTAKSFALEVIMSQRRELGMMKAALDLHGVAMPEYDPNRIAMGWMGMGTPVSQMPGIASPEDMAALADARGAEADDLFLELMRDHHQGGIVMGEYVAENGTNQWVRDLGARMAANQAIEVVEYTQLRQRLGFE